MMLKTRTQKITVLGLCAIVLGIAGIYSWTRRPDRDLLAFRRIEAGMTLDDVGLVLGGRPGTIETRPGRFFVGEVEEHWGQNNTPIIWWVNDNSTLVVSYSQKDSKVVGARF